MIVRKAFRFRLKPTSEQRQTLSCFAGACRFVYNRGLERRKRLYEEESKSMSYYEQNIELTQLKKCETTSWLKDAHSQILQQSLKDLDSAFKRFFRAKDGGYPKFKCKGIRDSFRYPQGVKKIDETVYLPKIGWMRFIKSREIIGEIKQTTISREGERWYVSFSCVIEKPDPEPVRLDEDKAIGIDVGLKTYVSCAIGTQNTPLNIEPPKFYHKLLPRLRVLQRRLSKKQKGSANWKKTRQKLAKLHAKIKHARENFAHQLSTWIVKNHDIICVESLKIKKMLQGKKYKLAGSISDAGWRQFLTYLSYKAKELGKHIVEAGEYYPSTKLCSSCGELQDMELNERVYNCKTCGLSIDRDYNSSITIKAAGISVLKACGAAPMSCGEARISLL